MQLDRQRLTREVERVHTRYQTEVVEAFSFCPWAKEARMNGHVAKVVSFQRTPDAVEALQQIDAALAVPATEVAMLIFPLLALSRLEFAHFVADIRAADETRSTRGDQHFALADFHPQAAADCRTAEVLVPFLRRAPDPMIQVVRTQVLAHVRGSEQGTSYIDPSQLALYALGGIDALPATPPSVGARVAEHNHRTVQRIGADHIEAVLRAISADRTRSYTACGISATTLAYMEDMYGPVTRNKLEKTGVQDG
jgi:hypothetical protein